MKKILTIIGARPQFIKCAPVSRTIRRNFTEILLHTGQHYDKNMSEVFFEELDIPKPHINLDIGSGTHGEQTGRMLVEIEKVILAEKPSAVIVYGDTNSTLAGALAGSKLLVPVFHIEAGLRSYNIKMPEEQNRIIADKLSTLLFCPTENAVENLKRENISDGVFNVGDVMYDSVLQNIKVAEKKSTIMNQLGINFKEYILATIHRAENTNEREKLSNIMNALKSSGELTVFPIHPRTRKYINEYGICISENIKLIDPVSYFDMLVLEKNAKKIITDSGGIQKEAFFLDSPCIIARDETEWTELIDIGANTLAGTDTGKLLEKINTFDGKKTETKSQLYGDGNSAVKILKHITDFLS